jgi:endonuclease/exonuclease/phosphatase (EEP) superfamily protein YafD
MSKSFHVFKISLDIFKILTNQLSSQTNPRRIGFIQFAPDEWKAVRIFTKWMIGSMLLCCSAGHAEMRVASLNIAKQYGPKVLGEIGAQPDLRKADVLLLQEVVDGSQAHMASEIAKVLGLKVVFEPAFQLNGQFMEGLAILSRYPIGPATVAPLSHNSLHFHTRKRIVMAVTAESPNGPVRIVNTHLDNRINRDAKREQLREIQQFLAGYDGPCILGGDFNSANFFWVSHLLPIPGVQSLRAVTNQEMEPHGFATPLGRGSGTEHFLGLKLDWIYLRGLTAQESGVTPIAFSDHNSVWVTIR